MAVFPGTTIEFKHGRAAYDVHGCRCEICSVAKSKARKALKKRLHGKEPSRHGTTNSYGIYGCRCDICRMAQSKRNKSYRISLAGCTPSKHGLTGYDVYKCRCEICVSAKNDSHLKRRSNPKIIISEKERGWKRQGIRDFTYDDFCALYDAQQGKCDVCGAEMKKESKLKSEVAQVDHDHSTGVVRGLLCHNCNKMLGCGRESGILRKGAEYLELHSQGGVS